VAERSLIGAPIKRREDERLLRGAGHFLDDSDDRWMLHVAIARAPYPHARVQAIDASAAREMPGVEAVLLGSEVATRAEPISILRPFPGLKAPLYHVMANGVTHFEGQAVVAIAARDRYLAEDAIEQVVIDYEPLPHVVDAETAAAPGAPLLHPELGSNVLAENMTEGGDAAAATEASKAKVSGRFQIGRVAGLPIETRGTLARYDIGSGGFEIVSSTQSPHLLRSQLALCLRKDESDIRVMAGAVGGSFGNKLGVYPEDVIVCLLAMDTGRPVKWVEDRIEHFRSCVHGREATHNATLASGPDGLLSALQDDYMIDIGAYNGPFGPSVMTSVTLPGPYRIANYHARRRVVVTNKVPMGAYRGYGPPESTFVREVLLDRLARQLGIDAAEIRRRNLLGQKDMPFRSASGAVYDSGDYQGCFALALRRVDYKALRARQKKQNGHGRRFGIGLACYVEHAGYSSALLGGSGVRFGAYESVTLRMDRSGRAIVSTGIPGFGQGTETAYAQLCANELGLDPERVIVQGGDTQGTPQSVGAFGSRATLAGGGAIIKAAAEVRRKILRLAAYQLELSPDDLELADGEVRSKDLGKTVPLAAVCEIAILGHSLPQGEDPGLEATAYWDQTATSFGFGTAVVVAQVDPRSGEFELERFILAHDCGRRLNPTLVEGQIHGGIAQGLGATMMEQIVYDPDSGQLVNGSMADYMVPTAADLPHFELEHTESPSPVTPHGIKGVGESGVIGAAAAVANAVCDALAPYGVQLHHIPITPEGVWRALREAKAKGR
jgi:carbon-monoxide dehydrogenase large subunit